MSDVARMHSPEGSPPAPAQAGPAPILVVEDDAVSAAVVKQHVATMGLANPVHIARDGDQAVEWLSRALSEPGGRVPALVLLDRDLPQRPGLEVLRWIHAQPRLRPVPVLMLTGSSDVDGISEAYALGARSYLVKPIGFEALGEVVRGLDLRWAILAPVEDQ